MGHHFAVLVWLVEAMQLPLGCRSIGQFVQFTLVSDRLQFQ
jgi:hypothetical protein